VRNHLCEITKRSQIIEENQGIRKIEVMKMRVCGARADTTTRTACWSQAEERPACRPTSTGKRGGGEKLKAQKQSHCEHREQWS